MTKKSTDEQNYRTSDIALAAYLKLKGLKLVQCGDRIHTAASWCVLDHCG